MKKEAKLFLEKAINSLIISVEHFNRPSNLGRTDAVLIFLDHAFEILLKAAILHRGGRIRKPGDTQNFGFDECLRKALTGGKKLKFLTEEQVILLRAINNLRDAAQHDLVIISEQHLYTQAQAGLTHFLKIVKDVFGEDSKLQLPARVLPLSTVAPTDLISLFESEVKEVERLLQSRKRHHVEAIARLRGLALVEGAVQGETFQPSEDELDHISEDIRAGKSWDKIFPGVASLNILAIGYGPSIDLRITKNEGLPIHLVPEGTPNATTLGVKRVDELSFYNLGRDQLAEKVGLSGYKTTAFIHFLNLQSDPECSKEFVIGKTRFRRYSQKAIFKIKEALTIHDIEAVCQLYKHSLRKSWSAVKNISPQIQLNTPRSTSVLISKPRR